MNSWHTKACIDPRLKMVLNSKTGPFPTPFTDVHFYIQFDRSDNPNTVSLAESAMAL